MPVPGASDGNQFIPSDYFRENYTMQVEVRHAEEAFLLTEQIIEARPELLAETVEGAGLMGEGLDRLWQGLDELLPVGAG